MKLQNLGQMRVLQNSARDAIGTVAAAGLSRRLGFHASQLFKTPVVIIAHNYEQLQR